MSAQMQIPYINADGSLNEAGYALLRDLEQANAELRETIAALEAVIAEITTSEGA